MAHLERFTRPNALIKGEWLGTTVKKEAEWVGTFNPGAVRRYGGQPLNAMRHAWRVAAARSNGLHAYYIFGERAAEVRGIATIITGLRIANAAGVSVVGNDVDYWTNENATPTFHAEVADAILQENQQLLLEAGNPDRTVDAFLVVPEGRDHVVPGLIAIMRPLGTVEPIAEVVPDNDYGVEKDGLPSQIYVRNPVDLAA